LGKKLNSFFPDYFSGPAMRRKKIGDVIKAHTAGLITMPGVVGIGEGKQGNASCIILFVVDKNSPELSQLPETIDGYRLRIEQSGELQVYE
jgi:hypothetical protein